MTGDDVPLLSEILRAANVVETLGNSWYKACKAWDSFPCQVTLLRKNSGFWQNQMRYYGMDWKNPGDRILSPLHEVQKLLDDEEAKLKRGFSKANEPALIRLIRKLTFKPAFPSMLGQSVAKLAQAFDNDVLDTLKLERARNENLCAKLWNLDFQKDERYVPLEDTESTVRRALERSGPGLVLLYGGVGAGKSTLARSVALQVHASRSNRVSGIHAFELAVFLDCRCDLEAKQREVRAWMGLDIWGREEILAKFMNTDDRDSVKQFRKSLDVDYKAERLSTSSTSTRAERGCRDVQILADKKLLIILDDVRNAEFLQEIINLCGKNGNWKLLVTSVMGDLCHGLNLTQIHFSAICMECIKQDDARNILISHIPWSTSNKFTIARSDFKVTLNDIIEETGANPLAMASIAGTIDENKYKEKEVWDNAADNMSWLLGTNNTASIHQKKYSKSFWEAMQEIFEDLRHESRSLLVLIAVCKGPSTQESVIEFFWKALFPSSSRSFFKKVSRQLESKQLIKMTGADTSLDPNASKQICWSVHRLVQRFIHERRRDDKTALLARMEAAMDKLVDTLVYNDHNVQEQGVHFLTNLAKGTQAMKWRIAKSRHVLNESIRALNEESSGNRRELVAAVLEILGEGDDDMRMRVVNFPNALEELVKAIMVQTQTPSLSAIHHEKHTIVRGQKDAPDGIPKQAARVLANLAKGDDYTKWRITACPGLLGVLINGMAGREGPIDVQEHIAWILINLAEGSHELKSEIVAFPGLLETLADAMTKRCNYAEHAARVLANLARGDHEIKTKLVNFPRVLEELINGVTDYHGGFQEQATVALANLADGENATKLKIVRVPRALEKLVSLLNEAENRNVQLNATSILANLARGDYDTKLRIVEQNGAFEQLVNAMAKEGDSSLQLNAIITLANLIAFDSEGNHVPAIRSKTLGSSTAIVTLGRGLGNDDSPDIQTHSRRALDNLFEISK